MPREARVTSESGRYHIMLRRINKQNIYENGGIDIKQYFDDEEEITDFRRLVF